MTEKHTGYALTRQSCPGDYPTVTWEEFVEWIGKLGVSLPPNTIKVEIASEIRSPSPYVQVTVYLGAECEYPGALPRLGGVVLVYYVGRPAKLTDRPPEVDKGASKENPNEDKPKA